MTFVAGNWLQAGAALCGVLLLLWLAARGVRATGLTKREGRRLAVQEVLALDSRRRLLLLRCDGREMLLLTGGGQDLSLGWLPRPDAP